MNEKGETGIPLVYVCGDARFVILGTESVLEGKSVYGVRRLNGEILFGTVGGMPWNTVSNECHV